jgi:glycosyltransferase involved in cell wall biosynthesis
VTFYPGEPLEKELSDAGIPVVTLGKRGRWDIAWPAFRLVRLILKTRPAIIHGYLTTGNLLTLIAKLFYPQIRVVWGVRASKMNWDHYDWFSKFLFQCECALSNFADLIIANSHAGRDYHIAHGFPRKRMVVIHNGIDTDRFRPDEHAGKRVRDEWGIKEGEKLIGLVGRLDPVKDHPTFLKAASLIVHHRKDVRFICVGEGTDEYRQKLHSLASELALGNRVLWTGTRQDLPSIYNAFEITVSASYGEGFPNVIGESMACGVPCVVTDVGDSALVVAECGVVVNPGDPTLLAQGINAALTGSVTNRRNEVRERIMTSFSMATCVNLSEEIFSNLLATKAGACW